ncbi:short-chain dehydrogenase [Actinoplanes cyaneus]|uniref:Short-chain dehydrogenase n=1 Tax=Actinoplanes cyaneus TaxID=52696 RepID=A0A919IG01_9ACTN|nr:SDR family NAD(P)-dependent oxidoreductase [Actinoplanes cyaneus]MCW2142171.1 Short-chain dehydrogenase [Actinoplanes cyaneus]GID63671.1 short-chain dehydrogenase [Actinoplanes cyaneus]
MRVAGKTLVVTGAGSELGRAVTLEAIRRGARVAAVDADPEALTETARQVVAPLLLSTHVADVTEPAEVEALPPAVIARWNAVDGVIHCAGAGEPVIRTFLPLLRARQEAHLVSVGDPPAAPDAARAAARRFAESVQAGANVHVAMVFPAGEAVTSPYRAARDLLDGMARDSYRAVVGSDVRLMNRIFGFSRR